MKTFKQFLSEDVSELAAFIEEHCAPFLRESERKGFLYRGLRNIDTKTVHQLGGEQFWEGKTRKDRKPVDSRQDDHEALDQWFDQNFGFKARSQAVFAVGSSISGKNVAKTYGTPFLFFPAGEFEYVWSPKVMDLQDAMHGRKGEYEGSLPYYFLEHEAKYRKTQLSTAVNSRNEVMVKCDKYYLFEASLLEKLKKELGVK